MLESPGGSKRPDSRGDPASALDCARSQSRQELIEVRDRLNELTQAVGAKGICLGQSALLDSSPSCPTSSRSMRRRAKGDFDRSAERSSAGAIASFGL
jgi:hypothetical protein